MSEPFRTALLLSMPQMQDPNFSRTVVLLCEYGPDGAFGLVVNRPTDMPASEMVRLQPPVVRGNDLRLYIGGPVQLIEVGASAGLNLLCDRYRLDYGTAGTTGPSDSPVRVDCRVLGGMPPIADRAPHLVTCVGLDREPIDLDDADSARWLLACVWPDTGRMERTAAAIALARTLQPEVVRGDAVRDVVALLDDVPDGTVACVTTTWAFAYLARDQRDAFVEQLAQASVKRPIAWISGEGPGVVDVFAAGEPPGHDPMMPSVLGAVLFDGGRREATMLAWVHPHGRWIDWLA